MSNFLFNFKIVYSFVICLCLVQKLQAHENLNLIKLSQYAAEQTSESNCKAQNEIISNNLDKLVYPIQLSEISIDETKNILELLWELNLAVKNQQNINNKNLDNLNCPFQTYDTLLKIRENINFFGKILATQLSNNNQIDLKKSKKLFSYSEYQIFKNSKFIFNSINDLKSGDVVLTRSSSEPMTYYSLQGDHYQPLTHATLIYKSPEGHIHLVESTGLGLTVKRLDNIPSTDEFWSREIVNIVVYRNKNLHLAQRAAEILYEIAVNFAEGSGNPKEFKNNLPYRAGIDVEVVDAITDKSFYKKENLFKGQDGRFNIGFSCIEAIRTAYRFAGEELKLSPYLVPFYKDYSRLDFFAFQKNRQGTLTTPISFFDIDYRFDIVAEWKNLNELSEVTDRDRALESIFSWVSKKHYRITEASPIIKAAVHSLFFNSTIYEVTSFLGLTVIAGEIASAQRFTMNLVKIMENSFWALGPVNKFVKQLQTERADRKLLPLPPLQLKLEIEKERSRDLQRWNNCKPTRFHDRIQPKEPRYCPETEPEFTNAL